MHTTGQDERTAVLSGGAVLVRTLEQQGAELAFGIPGTHNLAIYGALSESPIRHVSCRHESGAGYAADGYARASGNPGIVITTTGPGALNAATAGAQAWSDSVPLLIVAPGMPLRHPSASTGYLHEMPDQRLALEGAVGYAVRAVTHEELVRELISAFFAFRSGRPRPRYLEVPLDVLDLAAPAPPQLAWPALPEARPDAEAIARAAEILAAAERPLVIAGGGSHGAARHLAALMELGVPIITTTNGKGVVDEFHPHAFGPRLQVPSGRALVEDADAVLVVGSDLGDSDHSSALRARGRVIRVDLDPSQIHRELPASVGIVCDAGAALEALIEELGDRRVQSDEAWLGRRAELDREAEALGARWLAIARALESVLAPGDVVAADNAMVSYLGLLGTLRLRAGSRFLFPTGLGTLGYSLPAAIGAKLARPQSRVAAVIGDGGIMFSLAELATAAELELPLPVIVSMNGGYGEIRRGMLEYGFSPLAVDFEQPDFAKVARGLGCHALHVADSAQLGEALATAFEASAPTVLTVDEPR